MQQFRVRLTQGLGVLALASAFAGSLGAQALPNPMPLKYVGPATKSAITAGDLMTRLYKYADDSMMGRAVGTEYNLKATAYIESEVRRLGLMPAGDNGGYFQDIGMMHRSMDVSSTLTIDGVQYKAGVDFIVATNGPGRKIDNAQVYVWLIFDAASAPTAAQLAGKLVALRTSPQPAQAEIQAWQKSPAYQTYLSVAQGMSPAVGIISVAGDTFTTARVKSAMDPNAAGASMAAAGAPMNLAVTTRVMTAILGNMLVNTPSGTIGKAVSVEARFTDVPRGGRNVVAILPGSDSKLKGQYVAIGAHNDHIGFATRTVGQHDSLRIVNMHIRPAGAEGGRNMQANPVTPEEWAKINAEIADLRKIYPERSDSIFNGADDDGSGSVSVLEIAEMFAKGSAKPKRSILFVWHTGEEAGMLGSGFFMDHPTVPRDSIVAQLNIDMVGRGEATDVTGQAKGPQDSTGRFTGPGAELHGAPNYVQLVGSRRLSTELGDLVEKVNTDKKHGFVFDYNIDADGHQQNIYCRSDHWSYGKWGVPVVFFTTGGHADYHQVTDEPQYIQYDHMARIDKLIFDIAVAAANLNHRLVVDHPKPNPVPATSCKQ